MKAIATFLFSVIFCSLTSAQPGGWKQIGKPGAWKMTIQAVEAAGKIYTVGKTGILYEIYINQVFWHNNWMPLFIRDFGKAV